MSVNEITGDRIVTDVPSNKFKVGWEAIWGGKTEEDVQEILDSPSIMIPNGLSVEEMRALILKYAHLESGPRERALLSVASDITSRLNTDALAEGIQPRIRPIALRIF